MMKKQFKIGVVGLGYVGLPLAISFSRKLDVIGFDINEEKINKYIMGIDDTNEVGDEAIKNSKVKFTSNEKSLNEAQFFIVAVPTPIKIDKTPDLRPVIEASKIVGRNLNKGSIVVFESTVYPGVTEEICLPILENESGLKCGKDFKIGYSPERINPGDKSNRLENIVKIVSGIDKESLDIIASTYEMIIKAGVYRAESIKVAEAAKVIENSQRDINIAFVNEIAMILNKMGINTKSVLEAAGTKWNFLKFSPGLVGGHCIGVDPYYLTYKGEQLGYRAQIISSGRKVNDDMGKFIANEIIKQMIKYNKNINGSKIGILGITFKENCPDIRNTKVIDIIEELNEYSVECLVADYMANKNEVKKEYDIDLVNIEKFKELDCVVLAVAHDDYRNLKLSFLKELYNDGSKILVDIKSIVSRVEAENQGFIYWSL